MSIKEILKKYWFIGLVALGLIVYLVAYTVTSIQSRPSYVNSKNVDGKSVIYTLNGENYFADDLYADLEDNEILNAAYFAWSKAVIGDAIKTTDDLSTYATNYAAYISNNNDEATIDSYLKANGYPGGIDDLVEYSLDMLKADQLYHDYYTANFDKYAKNVIDAYQPKKVWHILIKVADVSAETVDGATKHIANPTAEEKAKLEEVLKALETEDFETAASNYSEDGSSAEGGYLGIYDSQSAPNTFVTEFADEVVALEYGSISEEPIVSEYGYHIVKVEKPTDDELKEDTNFISELSSFYSYPNAVAVKEKADELGYKFVDEKLANKLDDYTKKASEELASYNQKESEVSE